MSQVSCLVPHPRLFAELSYAPFFNNWGPKNRSGNVLFSLHSTRKHTWVSRSQSVHLPGAPVETQTSKQVGDSPTDNSLVTQTQVREGPSWRKGRRGKLIDVVVKDVYLRPPFRKDTPLMHTSVPTPLSGSRSPFHRHPTSPRPVRQALPRVLGYDLLDFRPDSSTVK